MRLSSLGVETLPYHLHDYYRHIRRASQHLLEAREAFHKTKGVPD